MTTSRKSSRIPVSSSHVTEMEQFDKMHLILQDRYMLFMTHCQMYEKVMFSSGSNVAFKQILKADYTLIS